MRAAHRAEPPHAPRASRAPHHAEPRTSRLKLAVLRKGVDALRTPERHPARIRAAGRGERGPSPKEGRREREQARESGSLHAQHGHDGVGRRGLARGARRARSEAAPGPLSARRDGGLFRFTREKIPWIPEVLKVSGTAEHKGHGSTTCTCSMLYASLQRRGEAWSLLARVMCRPAVRKMCDFSSRSTWVMDANKMIAVAS